MEMTQGNVFISAFDTQFRRDMFVVDDYTSTFENNPHPMWIFDEDTLEFLAVNDAAIEHYGYSRDEFLRMTLKDIRPSDNLEHLFQELEDARRNADRIWFPRVCKYQAKSGRLIDVQVARIRLDYRGHAAVLSLNEDVTARLQALEQLHREHVVLEERVQQRTAELQKANAELKSEIAERQRLEQRNNAFLKLGQSLAAATTAKEAGKIISDVAWDLFVWDAYSLDIYDGEQDGVTPVLYFDTVNGARTEVAIPEPHEKLLARAHRIIDKGPELILRERPLAGLANEFPFGNTAQISASLMFVPIQSRGKVIGILSVQTYRFQAFTENDLLTLQALADHCAGALERISAEQTLRAWEERNTTLLTAANVKLQYEIYERYRLEKRNEALSKLGRSLSAARSAMEAAFIISAAADELIGWDSCCLHLYDAPTRKAIRILKIDVIDGKRTTLEQSDRRFKLTPIMKKVLTQGQQLILRSNPPSFTGETEPFGDTSRPSASMMYVPVRKADTVTGFFSIQSYKPNAYQPEALLTLQVLADHCGGALDRIWTENALLKSEAQRNTILAATNAKLQREITERHRLEKELLETADNERRRIGHDLHDDVGQQLTGITLLAHGLEMRLANKKMRIESAEASKIRRLTVNTLQRARALAHGLTSFQLDENNLAAALNDLAARTQKNYKIRFDVRVRGSIPRLSTETVRQLCRITQEAVTNAVKHAAAKRVRVELSCEGSNLILHVQNNGRKFPSTTKTPGMGLRIMNYRASVIGASVEVKPNGKQGTVLTCILPVKPQSQEEPKH